MGITLKIWCPFFLDPNTMLKEERSSEVMHAKHGDYAISLMALNWQINMETVNPWELGP